MVGMADGFAQASGTVGHVNLHTAPGRRQRDGGDLQRPGEPLAAAGHRRPAGARADDAAGEPDQPRRDPDAAPAGQVELRAAARRGRAARARAARSTSPTRRAKGPVFVSIPMDDWEAEVDEDAASARDRALGRGRAGARPGRDGRARRAPRRRLEPGAGRRPRHRRGRRLGRGGRARRAPAAAGLGDPGAGRRPARLPRGPPELPRRAAAGDRPGRPDARGPRPGPRRRLLGLPLLPEHPGAAAARGRASWSRSPATPTRRRGRRWATRSSATSSLALLHLLGAVGESGARPRASRCPTPIPGEEQDPISRHRGDERARPRCSPRTASSSSSRRRARSRCATSCGSRGPAATTSAPAAASASASPPRSASSSPSPTARSSASSARARPSTRSPRSGAPSPTTSPVTFLVLRNAEYAILKWFAESRRSSGAPGARPARARHVAVAAGYGVDGARGRRRPRRARGALAEAIAAPEPRLVEVPVAPGMSLFS